MRLSLARLVGKHSFMASMSNLSGGCMYSSVHITPSLILAFIKDHIKKYNVHYICRRIERRNKYFVSSK